MKKIFFFLVFTVFFLYSYTQENVGIGTMSPDMTALLHLESTDKGFLLPRLDDTQRDAINNPAHGLMIFNISDSTVQFWNGECWLRSFQESCNDCLFNVTLSSLQDTIDRVVSDSVVVNGNINQYNGPQQPIAISVLSQLPTGMTVTINPNPLNGSGPFTITFKVTPFTPAGTYPIVIQAFCGNSMQNIIYTVTIEPCYILNVNNSINNYSMSVDLYNTYPSAPTNQPICVISIVAPGVTVGSTSANQPAFTTGNLPAGSLVAIINNGMIIARGGNGGIGNNPAANPPTTGAGGNGGNAINLTIDTQIDNAGYIFGGGGGGSAMAFQIGLPLGPIFFGVLIGAGGGGGAGLGLGGNIGTIIGLSFYNPGLNATGGLFGVQGSGGILNFPINLQQGPVSITLNPNVWGGDGGGYGFPGLPGLFQLSISAAAVINIPFIGPVSVPIVNNLNIPIPVPIPPPGQSGFIIKRNGFNTNLPDNLYNTSFLKGVIGN